MRDWVPLLIHPSLFSPLSSCIISPSFALVSGILFPTFLPFNRNRDRGKERVLNKEKRAKGDVKRMTNGEMYKKSHLLSPHCVDHSLSLSLFLSDSYCIISTDSFIHSFNLLFLSIFSYSSVLEESHDFYSFFSPFPLFFSHFFVTFLYVHFPCFLSLSLSLWSKRVLSSTCSLSIFPQNKEDDPSSSSHCFLFCCYLCNDVVSLEVSLHQRKKTMNKENVTFMKGFLVRAK